MYSQYENTHSHIPGEDLKWLCNTHNISIGQFVDRGENVQEGEVSLKWSMAQITFVTLHAALLS